ncbi:MULTISPECIES: hypothetical protein [unclassified Microcoleus]|uniref:hypothetical protein n=1 Tax=unclassified Microcoleus TaxID=2642155 RepID=UPI002FD669B3
MEETRTQAYLQLIETLLTCPNGEEPQILQANLELLDLGFVEVCKKVTAQLAETGKEKPRISSRGVILQGIVIN